MARRKTAQSAITKSPTSTISSYWRRTRSIFPFLNLPGELRNMIYTEFFARGYDSVNDCFDRRYDRIIRSTTGKTRLMQPKLATPAILLVCKQLYYESVVFLRAQTLMFRHGIGRLELSSLITMPTLEHVTSLVVSDIGHKPLDPAWVDTSFDGHHRLVLGLASIYSKPGHRLKRLEVQFLDQDLQKHVISCWNVSNGCDMRKWVELVSRAWRSVHGVKQVTISGWMPTAYADNLVRIMQSNFSPLLSLPLQIRQKIYKLAMQRDVKHGGQELSLDSDAQHLYTPTVLLMDRKTSAEAREVLSRMPLHLELDEPAMTPDGHHITMSITEIAGVRTLQKLKSLSIVIRHWTFVALLPELVRILLRRHQLDRFALHLQGLEPDHYYRVDGNAYLHNDIYHALLTLAHLRGIKKVSISGQMPLQMAQMLKHMMQLPKPEPAPSRGHGHAALLIH